MQITAEYFTFAQPAVNIQLFQILKLLLKVDITFTFSGMKIPTSLSVTAVKNINNMQSWS